KKLDSVGIFHRRIHHGSAMDIQALHVCLKTNGTLGRYMAPKIQAAEERPPAAKALRNLLLHERCRFLEKCHFLEYVGIVLFLWKSFSKLESYDVPLSPVEYSRDPSLGIDKLIAVNVSYPIVAALLRDRQRQIGVGDLSLFHKGKVAILDLAPV